MALLASLTIVAAACGDDSKDTAATTADSTAVETTTGEVHLRHHISPTGFYRGRKVLKTKADA